MNKLLSLEQDTTTSTVPTTPQRKQKAMIQAQKLETDLDDDQMVSLINLFQHDVSAAAAYLVLQRAGLRKAWVKDKLARNI